MLLQLVVKVCITALPRLQLPLTIGAGKLYQIGVIISISTKDGGDSKELVLLSGVESSPPTTSSRLSASRFRRLMMAQASAHRRRSHQSNIF